jgi:RNA polymerase sigma-70 factor (ECF subfamily)
MTPEEKCADETKAGQPTLYPHGFVTTHWSIVLAAGDESSPQVTAALEQLCRAYWFPLYAYVRRRGSTPEQAQDLTQEFFCRLLQKRWLSAVEKGHGRFRSYLLSALSNFLANEWDKANCQKRGGGVIQFSIDQTDAENRYLIELPDELTPEKLFDRRWANNLLAQVLDRLQAEFVESGSGGRFEDLKGYLQAGAADTYAATAARTGMSEGALKSAIHRLRLRFAALLRQEISKTVATPGEVDDELRHLLAALS